MPYSTCCGAHTNFTEMDICPDCLEHCDFEDDDDDEEEVAQDEQTENQIDQTKIDQNA
jgi:hypothetical protein